MQANAACLGRHYRCEIGATKNTFFIRSMIKHFYQMSTLILAIFEGE